MILSIKAQESLAILNDNLNYVSQYGATTAVDLGLVDLADTLEQKLWLLNSIVEASIICPGSVDPDAASAFRRILDRILEEDLGEAI